MTSAASLSVKQFAIISDFKVKAEAA